MTARRALIIDDNRGLAETIAEVLTEKGFEVDTASSGMEALIAWRDRPASLVVLDVDLPDIGGLTIARRFLRRAAGCDLVVMSAREPRRFLGSCEELGAVFLAKPFSPSHLMAAVRLVLQKRAARRSTPRAPRRLLGAHKPRALLQHTRRTRSSR